jgi:hypothetical protein
LTGSLDEWGDEKDPDKECEKILLARPPCDEMVECEEVDCRSVDDNPIFIPKKLPSGKFLTSGGLKYLNERGALCVASPQPEWMTGPDLLIRQKVYQAPLYHELQRHFRHLPPWAPDEDWPIPNCGKDESKEVLVRSVEKKESAKERRKRLLKKRIWEEYDRWKKKTDEWIGKFQWLSV